MKYLIALAALGAPAAHAAEASPCMRGSDAALTVESWEAEPADGKATKMTVTLMNNTGQDIKMVDASVGFDDALGKQLSAYVVTRDVQIAAGTAFGETKIWGPPVFDRLLTLEPDEVVAYACTKAVLYSDGTREDFD